MKQELKSAASSLNSENRQVLIPNGRLDYFPQAMGRQQADDLFASLRAQLDWALMPIIMFGREVMQPRLVAFHGETGLCYRYSGKTLEASGWPALLEGLRQQLERLLGEEFNSVLCNLYRDGSDYMGWHADNEPELGQEPVIASVSLGAPRRFVLKTRDGCQRHEISPAHGSLLVMSGTLQERWQHQVPRTSRPVGERINLTFRRVFPRDHRRR
jgi:alkylated DNA repair dioxygenase AlkB